MPEIEIRPATREDIPYIVSIDHAYQSNYVWQMDFLTEESQLSINFREVRLPRPVIVEYPRQPNRLSVEWDERAVVLVGILAGEIVAYLSISEDVAPTTAWVTDLAVNPNCRRQGIASALVLAAQEYSTRRRNRRMVLEMQSKNHAAIRLVKKLGYEFCGYNDHYYENQDIALFFAQALR